ncbi:MULTISPECIES: hypothetical protein [Bacillus amyloliquefaciens group]|uniref:hypothetical protein n=1 Tax=Bacillus amyloliquefaciens group TaxID=1938374 RepID=UPI0008281D6F|nr:MULTISPECIES: hypothetical protein [Bacillus amyloliquefaciens group]MCZ4247680.1 hypothetical protein [Bacillus amyloliquefaciens]MDQ8092973.1 hypothetical protein [Bacillus amyloliquefaciens]OCB95467.1 uncharacterized protein SRCM101294_02525 [Bacillus amyloliquefaciens]QBG58149.1 hypothetical protein D2M30_3850 [Bacillus amyloliquefaciens]
MLKGAGIILVLAAVVFVLLGVFLKLAAFIFVSILAIIAAVILFTILSRHHRNET